MFHTNDFFNDINITLIILLTIINHFEDHTHANIVPKEDQPELEVSLMYFSHIMHAAIISINSKLHYLTPIVLTINNAVVEIQHRLLKSGCHAKLDRFCNLISPLSLPSLFIRAAIEACSIHNQASENILKG